jgi:hypothetical protein
MMRKISSVIGHKWNVKQRVDEGSTQISDQTIIEEFIANPDNTFLVSFPRTGSHWLRMLTELYFGRPSLVRVFFYPERQDFLMLHTHDLELGVERSRVIYLYRHPVETIFSQLHYHNQRSDNREQITYWSDLYGRHLEKWLHSEQFSTRKTIITYEGMKKDLTVEFTKITEHFDQTLNRDQLEQVNKLVTKETVKRKTKQDEQVIQLKPSYEVERQRFRQNHSELVWSVVTKSRLFLLEIFDDLRH